MWLPLWYVLAFKSMTGQVPNYLSSNFISRGNISGQATRSCTHRARTLFQKQISRTFPGLFQDSDWFFQDSKIHINPFTPKILMLILLTVCHTFHTFLLEFNRFPELSRTSSPFPGLSSPGKCHNKIAGLSRFSRTHTNPVPSLICHFLKPIRDRDLFITEL